MKVILYKQYCATEVRQDLGEVVKTWCFVIYIWHNQLHCIKILEVIPSQTLHRGIPKCFISFSYTILICKIFQSFPVQIQEQNLLIAFPSCVSVQSGMNKKEKNLTHSIEMPGKALEGRTKGGKAPAFQPWEHMDKSSAAETCQVVVWPLRESWCWTRGFAVSS